MAKKRKLEAEPSQIKEEEQIIAEEEEEDPEEFIGDDEEAEIEYEEVEYEEEEEEEEEESEAEEDQPHNNGDVAEEPILSNNVGGDASMVLTNNGRGGELEEEPIEAILAAFSKETLVELLSQAAERYADVAARVRAWADVEPSQRKIFVHGLKWDTTTDTLFKEFAKYGEIEDCRVISDKNTGRSKGYGFVLFKTCRAARQALKEPQKLIDERMTSSQLASVGASPQQPVTEYTQRKIFVSNVGEELDPVKVKDFFSKYGEIEEGPLGLDRDTGKPKGFCLFTYKTVESAKLALAEPHKHFEGVVLHCQQAIDGPKPHKGGAKNLQYVDNVAPACVVNSSSVPPYMQAPRPPMVQPLPPSLNVDPAAVGQALTTLLAAQGGGLNLLGALGAVGVPGFGGSVVQGGYGMTGGANMGSNGMQGSWNQGGYPANQMRSRGRGRGQRGHRPRRGQYIMRGQ